MRRWQLSSINRIPLIGGGSHQRILFSARSMAGQLSPLLNVTLRQGGRISHISLDGKSIYDRYQTEAGRKVRLKQPVYRSIKAAVDQAQAYYAMTGTCAGFVTRIDL